MQPHASLDHDFGITGLTKLLKIRENPRDPEGILDFTRGILEVGGEEDAYEIVADVRRLTESELSDDVLSVLWLASTDSRFDPASTGVGIRDWLDRIADVALPHARLCAAAGSPPLLSGSCAELRPAVLNEIHSMAKDLTEKATESFHAAPLPMLIPSLVSTVNAVGADLGFRLFLRAMKVYFVRIGPARLARYHEIGEQLGYHEYVVEDGSLNVWFDLDD